MVHLQLFVGLLDDHGEHVQVEGFEAFPEPQVFFRDRDFESETIVVIVEKKKGRVVLVREIYGSVRDAKELLLVVASLQIEGDFELELAVRVQRKRSVPAPCVRAGHSSEH